MMETAILSDYSKVRFRAPTIEEQLMLDRVFGTTDYGLTDAQRETERRLGPIFLFVFLLIHLFIILFIILFIYLFICLFIYLKKEYTVGASRVGRTRIAH